jgi:hypothetical protein
MKLIVLILFLAAAGTALQTSAPGGRRDWIDPASGHRVIRISDDPGSSTLYFHDNAFSAAGDRMMLRTPKGVAVVEVGKLGGEDLKLDVDYVTGRGGVEPNVHITPDKKWVVFTGQFAPGDRHVYALEIAGQK